MPAVRLYVINLKQAEERWAKVAANAEAAGLAIARIEAVDGNAFAPPDWEGFDRRAFTLWHGRRPLPGEYGCYRSHLAALETFLADGGDWALIAEDDAEFHHDIVPRTEALIARLPQAEIIRLFSFRHAGFFVWARTAFGDGIGRAAFGPQGSSLCYAVSRPAAAKLLASLQPCFLPLDVAMERGWANGVKTFSARGNLAALSIQAHSSQIGGRFHYGVTKLPAVLRLPALAFRTLEFIRRLEYAIRFR